jgi:hypothetical protein
MKIDLLDHISQYWLVYQGNHTEYTKVRSIKFGPNGPGGHNALEE